MTVDQVNGLLRQILPIIGTVLTAIGVNSATANALVDLTLTIAGPTMVVASAIWAFIANSRKSIMAAAAKPVDSKTPAPQIVLPIAEADLAQALPSNVNTTETRKVVAQ